jgi:iron complex outermembrane recepter protein
MNFYNFGPLFLLTFFSIVSNSFSQDSVKTYKLDEVTVKSGLILEPKTVTEIKLKSIKNSDASAINDFAKFIPSVKVQNNSRGESQIYLRSSNARQISLFFDGVPLNIPWDNRIDLSLVPADAIGYISVTKGVPSIVYGANTIAGVVNINTKEIQSGKSEANIKSQFGDNSFKRFSGFWQDGFDKFSYILSLSYKKTNGFKLPASFSNTVENPSDYRTNSFSENLNTFAKINYSPSPFSKFGLSISYYDSEKGVPAELDVENPRYWQYPLWRKLNVIFNGEHNASSSIFAYSFSVSKLESEIQQFTDNSYTDIDDIEKGDDITFFGRINIQKIINTNSIIRASLSGHLSAHKESFLSGNYSELEYSENLFSTGVEYEYVKSNFSGLLGVSYDGAFTPKTGDKPDKDGITDYAINSGFAYSFESGWTVKLNFGRKTRFPTLREAFSGALGRFIANPSLKAESAYNGEANIIYRNSISQTDLNIFATFLSDGIVRQSLPEGQFKRINKDKIRTLGFEFNTDWSIAENFEFNFNFAYLNSFAKNADGEFKDTLEYHPQINTGLVLNYIYNEKLNSQLEANYIGKEYGLKEGSEYFQKLSDYLLLNWRISYIFSYDQLYNLELFFRINNIFDKLYYTQWGLPEAGREFFAGFSFEFKSN